MALDTTTVDVTNITSMEEVLSALFAEKGVITDIGSTFRELVIRPHAVLAEQQNVNAKYFMQAASLYSAINGTNTDDAMIDAIASNYKLTRLPAMAYSGTAAVFVNAVTPTYIQKNTLLEIGASFVKLAYTYVGVPSLDGYTDSDNVKYVVITESNGLKYFIVPVTVSGLNSSIPSGTPVVLGTTLANITSVTVVSPISGGRAVETNAELAARVLYGTGVGGLSGKDQIKATISTTFGIDPKNVNTFGYSDIEQSRDVNPILGIHTGGCVDVVVNAAITPASIDLTLTAVKNTDTGKHELMMPFDLSGVLFVSNISLAGVDQSLGFSDVTLIPAPVNTVTTYHKAPTADSVRGSQHVHLKVTFDAPEGVSDSVTCTVTVVYMPKIAEIQVFVDSTSGTMPGQDIMVKAPVPCYLAIQAPVKPIGDTVPDISLVNAALAAYINNLPLGQETITGSDIVAALSKAGVQCLFPVFMQTTTIIGNNKYVLNSLDGRISCYTDQEAGVTARNTAFYCLTSDVDLTYEA